MGLVVIATSGTETETAVAAAELAAALVKAKYAPTATSATNAVTPQAIPTIPPTLSEADDDNVDDEGKE